MKFIPSPQGDLYIGSVKNGLTQVVQDLNASSIFLIADENTARFCVPELPSEDIGQLIILPAGESNKNLDSCQVVWSSLLAKGADRSSLVLNLGGGMICDLGGFAAACFQRGIRFGHIPTSVLAMADAAIGGKTGVNYQGFKNYIGRIEPPSFVWIDPDFIRTLPQSEIVGGFAEIVKHAIVGSRPLWDFISELENLNDPPWTRIFEKNTPIKQGIIEADPMEKGLRKVLNFGHTIGHALESHFMDLPHPLSHGQAITLGMLAESRIALRMGLLGQEDFHSIIRLIHRLLQPVEVTLPALEVIQPWVLGDKKRSGGLLGFSLPDRIGSCGYGIVVEDEMIAESLYWLSAHVGASSERLKEEK